MTESNEKSATREERFTAYENHLSKLRRDRVTLREVLEREILLGFIRTNRATINEFPLLDAQQETVIELMCQRLDHPAYDFIRNLTGSFIAQLGHYRKAKTNNDPELLESTTIKLGNTEGLLIKCMQGIVYSIGLISDNVEELVVRMYGQASMNDFSEMLKARQMDRIFWKDFFDRFVARPVANGHEAIISGQRFSLKKEGNMLAARMPLDTIYEQLCPANGKLEKTRIQKAFESTVTDPDVKRTLKVVQVALVKGLSFIPGELLSKNDVSAISRVVCIDSTATTFRDAYLQRLEGKSKDTDEERTRFKYLMEQITALGVGATIGVSISQQNLSSAMLGLVPGNVEALSAMGRNFRLANIRRLLIGLIEEHFILRLQEQAEDDLGKVQIIKSRVRRVPMAEVKALGLSKIRLNKLFRADPADPSNLLFRPRNDAEMAGLIKMLQLEAESASALIRMWRSGNAKVEIMLLVDLTQLARTTTNLQGRVQEILKRFDLVGQPKPKSQEAETSA